MKRNKILIFYGIFQKNRSYDWIPYGPVFLCSRLKAAGFEPIFIHEYGNANYRDTIRKYANELLFFGVSSATGLQIESSIKAVKEARALVPEVPIIWGGAHATAVPYQTVQSEYVDYVCVGQASENIIQFAKAIQDGRKIEGIPDILSKEDAIAAGCSSVYTVKNYKIDYQKFPKIYLDDFDFSYLLTENRVLNYHSSTGCPGLCTFCSWGGMHPWRHLPVERVLDDVEYLVNRYNLSSLYFTDPTLGPHKNYLLGIASGILDRLDIYWRCNMRVEELLRLDPEDIGLLERSGLDLVILGVENINRECLKILGKNFSPEMVTDIVKKMSRFKIIIQMGFIFGLPGAPLLDLEENRKYIDMWQSYNPRVFIDANMYKPLPGTPMEKRAITFGYKPPRKLEDYTVCMNVGDIEKGRIEGELSLPLIGKKEGERYNKCFFELFKKAETVITLWGWREKGDVIAKNTFQS